MFEIFFKNMQISLDDYQVIQLYMLHLSHLSFENDKIYCFKFFQINVFTNKNLKMTLNNNQGHIYWLIKKAVIVQNVFSIICFNFSVLLKTKTCLLIIRIYKLSPYLYRVKTIISIILLKMKFLSLIFVMFMVFLTTSFMPAPGNGLPQNGGISANIHGCPNCQGSIHVQAPIQGGGHINGGVTFGNGGVVSGGIGITIPF